MANRPFIWLASYPKSGNTWLRAFLTNLILKSEKPAGFNQFVGWPGASSRSIFDRYSGVASTDLSHEEILDLRPEVFRSWAQDVESPVYVKVHEACLTTSTGQSLFPADVTKAVIHIVRNPLDVAVSYAHHDGCTTEEAIRMMRDEYHGLDMNLAKSSHHLPQPMGRWDAHANSWLKQTDLPVLTIRYEDFNEPTFRKVAEFLGLKFDNRDLKRAMAFSSFDQLKAQEEASGMPMKKQKAPSFFRSGQIGDGARKLNDRQIASILSSFTTTVRELGYTNDS